MIILMPVMMMMIMSIYDACDNDDDYDDACDFDDNDDDDWVLTDMTAARKIFAAAWTTVGRKPADVETRLSPDDVYHGLTD